MINNEGDKCYIEAVILAFGFEDVKDSSGKKIKKVLKVGLKNDESELGFPTYIIKKEKSIEETLTEAVRNDLNSDGNNQILIQNFSDPDRYPEAKVIAGAYLFPVNRFEDTKYCWYSVDYEENEGEEQIILEKDHIKITLYYVDGLYMGMRILNYDHAQILYEAMKKLRDEVLHHELIFELLPEKFTLSDLQSCYEFITRSQTTKQNFRQKFISKLKETGEFEREGAFRPSKFYKKK